ncbi:hypothetical protein [Streptomyces sp. OE57]|uniref:hypothetical protein n=1 Tax=Streptomyces lacaronensis TaxID=3379885 RepID=UPI0039B78F38
MLSERRAVALPPRQAVEELARVGGVEPTRLLVLHEVAEAAWRERTAVWDERPMRAEHRNQGAYALGC